MNLAEYASHDGLGLAALVKRREVSPKELAAAAAAAVAKVNPVLNCVVETYADRIGTLDEAGLGDGPFRGVPFLIKDVFGHEAGRKCEFGSRLCEGMVTPVDTNLIVQLRRAGINTLGRSNAPEYSMAGTTESVFHGNCSTPWRQGYSAGGSSGGAASAVAAGIVPLAHGSDIGGSIRIPASMCGGVGFKPSRMRISIGPVVDEGGWGYSMNFVQSKTLRDAAAMLDCLCDPLDGDPFVIPRPDARYASLLERAPKALRIGIVLDATSGIAPDPEVAAAVEVTGKRLAALGHHVEMASVSTGGVDILAALHDVFFFDFDNRLDGYAQRTGRKPGPDTLEPAILAMYEHAKEITPARFTASWAKTNVARRALSAFWSKFDIWLSPATARTAEPWGRYNLSAPGADHTTIGPALWAPTTQYTIPHNLMGTPAISLPLMIHSNGLPIGVQLAAKPAADHLVLQLARVLEQEMAWAARIPPLHVSRL